MGQSLRQAVGQADGQACRRALTATQVEQAPHCCHAGVRAGHIQLGICSAKGQAAGSRLSSVLGIRQVASKGNLWASQGDSQAARQERQAGQAGSPPDTVHLSEAISYTTRPWRPSAQQEQGYACQKRQVKHIMHNQALGSLCTHTAGGGACRWGKGWSAQLWRPEPCFFSSVFRVSVTDTGRPPHQDGAYQLMANPCCEPLL